MAEKKIDGNLALNRPGRQIIEIKAEKRKQQPKLRVAAYVRVSSSSEDQLNSFEAQRRHYSQLISSQEDWTLAEIYADEGITGTSMEKRDGFLRLLADCRRGLIDRVLVKSVSRFARNTKECLLAVRELKAMNVSVYFEEQHIDTAIATGETMTTMFASIAQAESESISQNMRWSYQRRMRAGSYVPHTRPYGYHRTETGLSICEEEARVVRRIYDEYLDGANLIEIANHLNEDGVVNRNGEVRWSVNGIKYILTNEKYIGDSLWQKFYTTEVLPYQCSRNHGEKESFYATATHEPLISVETYQTVQKLMSSKAETLQLSEKKGEPFRKMIWCGVCGNVYRRKKVRQEIYWVCRGHDSGKADCHVTQIPEQEFANAFLRLYYKLKQADIGLLRGMLQTLENIRERQYLWSPNIIDLNNQIAELLSQNHTLAALKQQGLVDPDIFISQSNALAEQLQSLKLQKERLMASDEDGTIEQTRLMIEVLEEGPDFLDTFDEELFGELIDKIIVDNNDQLRFCLKNGVELREKIERTKR